MTKGVKPGKVSESHGRRCGNCFYFEIDADDVLAGTCYVDPPAVIIDEDGDLCCPDRMVMAVRPMCRHYKANQ
jgi:hypothetical protein